MTSAGEHTAATITKKRAAGNKKVTRVRTKAHSNNRYRDPVGDPGNHKKLSPVGGRGFASAGRQLLRVWPVGRRPCHVKCRRAPSGLHPCCQACRNALLAVARRRP